MRFSILSSGSSGNATLIASDTTSILVDCGISTKLLKQRAAVLPFDVNSLSAILVTHEHGDHAGGVAALARHLGIPVYLTHGTSVATNMHQQRNVEVNEFSPHTAFGIGDLLIHPAPVPHDAREPCQFVIENGPLRLGILTDIGSITPHIEQHYQGCHGLILEFNHDRQLLAECDYPESLKARVGGRYGHFSNDQARELLEKLKAPDLSMVVAAHLSEQSNNTYEVEQILIELLGEHPSQWRIASRHSAMPWISLSN